MPGFITLPEATCEIYIVLLYFRNTDFVKYKIYRIKMFLLFNIHFILLLIFVLFQKNKCFGLVFFLIRTSMLLSKTLLPMSEFVRISATPLPPSPRTSFVNGPYFL